MQPTRLGDRGETKGKKKWNKKAFRKSLEGTVYKKENKKLRHVQSANVTEGEGSSGSVASHGSTF